MPDVHVAVQPWDARIALPNGVEDLSSDTPAMRAAIQLVVDAVHAGGQVVVLPGPEPHQSLLVAVHHR